MMVRYGTLVLRCVVIPILLRLVAICDAEKSHLASNVLFQQKGSFWGHKRQVFSTGSGKNGYPFEPRRQVSDDEEKEGEEEQPQDVTQSMSPVEDEDSVINGIWQTTPTPVEMAENVLDELAAAAKGMSVKRASPDIIHNNVLNTKMPTLVSRKHISPKNLVMAKNNLRLRRQVIDHDSKKVEDSDSPTVALTMPYVANKDSVMKGSLETNPKAEKMVVNMLGDLTAAANRLTQMPLGIVQNNLLESMIPSLTSQKNISLNESVMMGDDFLAVTDNSQSAMNRTRFEAVREIFDDGEDSGVPAMSPVEDEDLVINSIWQTIPTPVEMAENVLDELAAAATRFEAGRKVFDNGEDSGVPAITWDKTIDVLADVANSAMSSPQQLN